MDESLVVFCIDTSGSMCVTTKVIVKYLFQVVNTKPVEYTLPP